MLIVTEVWQSSRYQPPSLPHPYRIFPIPTPSPWGLSPPYPHAIYYRPHPIPWSPSPSPPHPHAIYYRLHPIPWSPSPSPPVLKMFTSFIQNRFVTEVIQFNTAAECNRNPLCMQLPFVYRGTAKSRHTQLHSRIQHIPNVHENLNHSVVLSHRPSPLLWYSRGSCSHYCRNTVNSWPNATVIPQISAPFPRYHR